MSKVVINLITPEGTPERPAKAKGPGYSKNNPISLLTPTPAKLNHHKVPIPWNSPPPTFVPMEPEPVWVYPPWEQDLPEQTMTPPSSCEKPHLEYPGNQEEWFASMEPCYSVISPNHSPMCSGWGVPNTRRVCSVKRKLHFD